MKRMLLPQSLVASLLSGATQVSTPVKPQPAWNAELEMWTWPNVMNGYASCYPTEGLVDWLTQHCHFPVGAEVWVPETWMPDGADCRFGMMQRGEIPTDIVYKHDSPHYGKYFKWRPSSTMPSWAARLRYIIEEVKVEKQGDDDYGTFMWVYTYTVRRL